MLIGHIIEKKKSFSCTFLFSQIHMRIPRKDSKPEADMSQVPRRSSWNPNLNIVIIFFLRLIYVKRISSH